MTASRIYISKQKALKYHSHNSRTDIVVGILYVFLFFSGSSFATYYTFLHLKMQLWNQICYCVFFISGHSLFSVKSCRSSDVHEHTSLYGNAGLVNANCSLIVQCWQLWQWGLYCRGEGSKVGKLKSSLFCAKSTRCEKIHLVLEQVELHVEDIFYTESMILSKQFFHLVENNYLIKILISIISTKEYFELI